MLLIVRKEGFISPRTPILAYLAKLDDCEDYGFFGTE